MTTRFHHSSHRIPLLRRAVIFAVLGLLVFSVGCGTTREHRIRQYARDFHQLEPERQMAVREGIIGIGSRPLEVYLVYGPPNRIQQFAVPSVEPGDLWTYVGIVEDGAFRSSFDWAWLPSSEMLQECVIVFGPDRLVSGLRIGPPPSTP